MVGIRNFVLGFTVSFLAITVCEGFCSVEPQKNKPDTSQKIAINLFKPLHITEHTSTSPKLFAAVEKKSLPCIEKITPDVQVSPEGIEDDEILGINIDDNIPIEFSHNDNKRIDITSDADSEKVASLPDDISSDVSPWVSVKGAPNIKNKNLLEEINKQADASLFTQSKSSHADNHSSYMVAEKIKQSLIFPIPDEILNDEDLTPTFIRRSTPKKKTHNSTDLPQSQNIKIIDKVSHETKEKESDSGILNSISSWFSDKPQVSKTSSLTNKNIRKAPSYSSQDKEKSTTKTSDDLASFYESLQQTKREYNQKSITPQELKLTFQPDRAEISGSTLRWLKTFSQATIQSNTGLEIRLDVSASEELQKKRLNLLYTILSNNGVDIEKIQTFFVSTTPNTFIIRRIKPHEI